MRGGIERDVILCAATGQSNAEILENLSATLNCNCEQPIICKAKTQITILNDQGGNSLSVEKDNISPTLRSETHGNLPIVCAAFMAGQAKNARSIAYSETISPTLKGSPSGLNQMPCVCEADKANAYTLRMREGCAGGGKGALIQTEKSGTLATGNDQYLFCAATTQANAEILSDLCPTITAAAGTSGNNKPYVVHPDVCGTLCASGAGLSRPAGMVSETDLCVAYPNAVAYGESAYGDYKENIVSTLKNSGGCIGGGSETLINCCNPVKTGYVVRRLTPTEAERLMSLPDGWTEYGHDGKLMSDTTRYQMCGNSIVVNCLAYIMQNIAEHLNKDNKK